MTDTAVPRAKLNFATDWSYAPAPESAGHAKLKDRYDLFINGKFVAPAKGDYFDTINPANEKKLGEVAAATGEDVDAAGPAPPPARDKASAEETPPESG